MVQKVKMYIPRCCITSVRGDGLTDQSLQIDTCTSRSDPRPGLRTEALSAACLKDRLVGFGSIKKADSTLFPDHSHPTTKPRGELFLVCYFPPLLCVCAHTCSTFYLREMKEETFANYLIFSE